MNDQKHSQDNNKTPENLGVAGGMAKAFITSPMSLLLLLTFFAIGALGLAITPRQEDPQISVPMADIYVQYPGASAKEVESLVARPLEGIMSEMTGVDHVYSISKRGVAMVTVQFKVGENFEKSLVKLYNQIASNKDRMPIGVMEPLIKPKSVDDVPIVTLTLWSNSVDDANLRLVGLDLLQSLREIANTSQSFIVSGREEQVRVEILPERLATYGISLDNIANAIRGANSQRKAGSVEPKDRYINVYTGSFLTSAEDIRRLMVAVVDGRPVYIRDVAKVIEGPSVAKKMVGYYTGANLEEDKEKADNAAAVTIAIAKKHGTNGVEVADAIMEKVNHLKGRMIPDNVYVEVTRNYGETAKEKVNHLLLKLFKATGIVSILVFIFLGWRAALVVTLVIPSVITTTVFSAWLLGMTIDRVSLFALIFSIGILVDDAIVVVENIYRRWLLAGSLDEDIAVDAVREVGNPTILATITVVAALVPMGMVGGMMGPYMSPIPILASVAMAISLFAAFAFTPWLTNKFKPSLDNLHEAEEREHRQAAMVAKFFRTLIIPLIRDTKKGYAFLGVIVIAFFLFLGLFYTHGVKVKMLPLDNKPEFNIVINFPEGTALTKTANLTNKLARIMREVPEVTALQTYVGTASPFNFNGFVRHYYLRQYPWQADIQVQLIHKDKRERTSHEIAEEAREILTPIAKEAGAKIQIVEMPPGPPVLQSVVAEVYGPDAETRRQVAADLTKFFEEAKYLGDVDNLMEAPHKLLRFQVDAEKAQRNGISVEDINRSVEMAMGDYVLGDIKMHPNMEQRQLDAKKIILQVPLAARTQINRLIQLPVTNRMGKSVPLSELGTFIREFEDKPIFHKDLRPVEFVTAETIGELAAPVYGQFEVENLIKQSGYRAPDNVELKSFWCIIDCAKDDTSQFDWGGEWTVTWETFHDMGIAFMGALVLIYMVIVAQFGNFILPAVIMAPIPLTLIGIMPGHWLLGADFSATSMIGFIALAGIIVRNSILLVDFSRQCVMEGMPVTEAVIKACEARTRPIAITALALIGGSMVILDDPIFQGMAVSLIFGGAVSTALTLLVIPLGCISAGKSLCANANSNNGNGGTSCNVDLSHVKEEIAELSLPEDKDNKKESTLVTAAKMLGLYTVSLVQSIATGIKDTGIAIRKFFEARQQKKLAKTVVVRHTSSKKSSASKAKIRAEAFESTEIEEKSEVKTKLEPNPNKVEKKPESASQSAIVSKKLDSKDALDAKSKKLSKKSKNRRGIRLKKDL